MNTDTIAAFVLLGLAGIIQTFASAVIKLADRFGLNWKNGEICGILLLGLALVLFGLSFPLIASGMGKVKLSMAQPFIVAVSFLTMTPLALVLFKESIGIGQLLGMALIVIGVTVMFAWGNAEP